MPQIRTQNIASRTWQNIVAGKAGRKALSRAASEAGDTVIADSIYSLRLRERLGIEVFVNANSSGLKIACYEKLFDDLWNSYCHYQKLKSGEEININVRKFGLRLDMCFFHLVTSFRKLLPREAIIRIEEINGRYCFGAYQMVPWNWQLSVLVVKPFLDSIKSERLRLVFLQFLRTFSARADVSFWCDGFFGYAEEQLRDAEQYYEEDVDIKDAKRVLKEYTSGTPARLVKELKGVSAITVAELNRRISRFNAQDPVVQLMRSAIPLLEPGISLGHYICSSELEPDESFCGVRLEDQQLIAWDTDDKYFQIIEENMDASAQEGVARPALHMIVNQKLEVPWEKLNRTSYQWPLMLQEFFNRSHDLAKKAMKNGRNKR